MKEERGTLADLFIHEHSQLGNHMVERDTTARVVAKLKAAASHRFVFTAAASERFAEVVRDCPELLAQHQQFARAPYDTTWVEFDFHSFYAIRNAKLPSALVNVGDPTGDLRMGYLIDHDDVYVVCSGRTDSKHPNGGGPENCSLLPFTYQLHTEWSVNDQLEFCNKAGISRAQLDYFFWGGTYYDTQKRTFDKLTSEDVPQEWIRSLRANNAVNFLPLTPRFRSHARKFINIVGGGSGELRNIIGALLILNRPSLIRYVREVAHSRHFSRGKLRPYLSHTVVEIPLDPRPIIRKLYTGGDQRNSPRRHEVRGTYCHNDEARRFSKLGCAHDWRVLPHARLDKLGRPAQWECAHCHGARWWRDHHVRGDATEGYVNKDYEVTE